MYLGEIDSMEQEMHVLDRFVHVERQRRKARHLPALPPLSFSAIPCRSAAAHVDPRFGISSQAQASGWSDLSRLQQQLTATEAKIDRAKQKLYFPEVKGYRCGLPSCGHPLQARAHIPWMSAQPHIRHTALQVHRWQQQGVRGRQRLVHLRGAPARIHACCPLLIPLQAPAPHGAPLGHGPAFQPPLSTN